MFSQVNHEGFILYLIAAVVCLGLIGNFSCTAPEYTGGENKLGPEITLSCDLFDIPNEGTYDFGNCEADGNDGAATEVSVFTVENTGDENLIFSYLSFTSDNLDNFDLSHNLTKVLYPSGSAKLQISFDPLTPGSKSAIITFSSNDEDESTFTFYIQGIGL
ncbi:MAG: choice-of-anchor D domain-containing protein [Spirochaetales bacterium]|nr:choice-of-anchor D domain-containing protein [Spirochaetales bacterium]